ncbi:histidine phosphatase superfamily [Syncephalis fuscata]|nr:histidine phosphatase superfamily [Syncephalis fuscata]
MMPDSPSSVQAIDAVSSPSASSSSPLSSSPPPYATLLLIRHGETELNAKDILQGALVDYPLNNIGKEQARLLGARLSRERTDLVVASAMQTVPELAEISWGDFDGKANQDLSQLMDSWNAGNFDARPPGGESAAEVEKRALPAIHRLLEEHGGHNEHLVIVVHGRLLRILLSSLLDGVLDRMRIYQHRNTCINEIRVYHDPTRSTPRSFVGRQSPSSAREALSDYRFESVYLNDTQHLALLKPTPTAEATTPANHS